MRAIYIMASLFYICYHYLQVFVPDNNWRVAYATAPLFPSFLAFLCLMQMPESPRWLLMQGLKKDAREALDFVFQSHPLIGRVHVGKAPDVVVSKEEEAKVDESLWDAIGSVFTPPLLSIWLICTILYTLHAGVCNGFWMWSIEFYQMQKHYIIPLGFNHVTQLAAVASTIFCMLLVETVGRRALLVIGFTLSAITLFLQTQEMSIPASLACLVGLEFSATIGWVVLAIYMTEVFPTKIRGTAAGFACFLGRIASVVLPSVFGLCMRDSAYPVTRVFACTWVFAAVVACAIPYETSQMSLQDGVHQSESRVRGPVQ